MDASIVVVGNQSFYHTIDNLLSNMPTWVVESATDIVEAKALITSQQPDILIFEANDAANLELSQWIRTQSRLSWIYQIFVETWGRLDHKPTVTNHAPIAYNREAAITALEYGADSYFSLPRQIEETLNSFSPSIQQLLIAQVQAGLRRVKNDRELVQANDLLSAIALSDPLTELNNRRAFEWELPRQVQISRDQDIPFSLLMLDIDFFKRINDEHGHLVGDQVLRMVANRLRHNLRFYDTPFRYGGEEFSIILSNTALPEATRIGQRICHLIADQPFVIDSSLQLVVTLSIGGASLQADDLETGLSLLQRADQNLLAAKANGRNQIISNDAINYPPPPPTINGGVSKGALKLSLSSLG